MKSFDPFKKKSIGHLVRFWEEGQTKNNSTLL